MSISMIVHFNGLCHPNNLVLIFMYFINYPTVTFIDVKYHSLYISIRDKVLQPRPCNAVPKVIVGYQTQLLLLIPDYRSAASVCSRHLFPDPIIWETNHSYYQAILITACVLNPSDDMGD